MEKKIFNGWFKFSKVYLDHAKYLIKGTYSDRYVGYYYLTLYSILASDCDVIMSGGKLPVNEDGNLDMSKISIILDIDKIEAVSFINLLKECGLYNDGYLTNIDLFYGNLHRKAFDNKRYYDPKRGIFHQSGKVVWCDSHHNSFYKLLKDLSSEELIDAKAYALEAIEAGKKYKEKELKE